MSRDSIYKLIVLTLFCFSNANGFLHYGETCDPNEGNNPDLACDLSIGLTCRYETCRCLNPSDMISNSTTGGCSTLVGGNCTVEFQGRETIELPCTSDAWCDGEGICRCSEYYSPTEGRGCKASHTAACKETSDCNERELLVCSQDFCQCPNPLKQDYTHYYDSYVGVFEISKCFAKVGSPCNPNASESEIQCEPGESTTCIPDSNSITGFGCACDESQGWLEDFSQNCYRGYQQSCNLTLDPSNILDSTGNCNMDAGLFCSKDKCLCQYAPDQIWDEEIKLCASVEGSPCDVIDDDGNLICHTGLECAHSVRQPVEGICRKPQQEATDPPKSTSSPVNNNGSGSTSIQSVNHNTLKYLVVITGVNVLKNYCTNL